MEFEHKGEVFVPDGSSSEEALARTTHMAFGAHQDDIEIMAWDGVNRCFQCTDLWFSGVVVADGRGSPRQGIYETYSDDDMLLVRTREQKKAAVVGEYSAQVMLNYPSQSVKDGSNKGPVRDIHQLMEAARPRVVYTHSLTDKHDTHVAVALRVIEAVRALPDAERPQCLYGCEVWRDLDWMVDTDKVAFDSSVRENLQSAILGVFDSQISGGKRYDLATMGRRRAHATYHTSHVTDVTTGAIFAMDLTPLIENPSTDIRSFVESSIERFVREVRTRLIRLA